MTFNNCNDILNFRKHKTIWPSTQIYVQQTKRFGIYKVSHRYYVQNQVNHVVNMCAHVKASIRNMHRSVLKESWFEKKNEEMILIKGESTSCSNHRGSRCHSSSCCCSSPQCVELKQNVAFWEAQLWILKGKPIC